MKTGPLKRLKVTNFQRHEELDLDDLSPGVNVFVGRSGQGKSAGIFRPMWLIYANRPVGDEYARDPEILGLPGSKWDKGPTIVESWWDDPEGETQISRVRGKDTGKDNYYSLGDGVKRRGFGNGSPPEEILEALNLADLNFDSQHGSLYLLSSKPLEVARELNDIIGLDDIDRAYEYINGRKWKESQEKRTQKALVDSASKSLSQYDKLPDLESRLQVIEELERRARESRSKSLWLRSKAESLRQARAELSKYRDLPALQASFSKIKGKFQALSDTEDRIDSLQAIADKLRKAGADHKAFASLDEANHRVSALLVKKVETLNATLENIRSLKGLSSKLKTIRAEKDQADKELKAAEKEFSALIKDRCPICGRGGGKQ